MSMVVKREDDQTKWHLSHRADPRALPLANRHYTRQKIDSPQFVPPGRCIVLLTRQSDALWVTSYPLAAYVKHAWAGAWICSLFRNESPALASQLIVDAVAITRWHAERAWDGIPPLGMVTFVDPTRIRSDHPGYCYKRAGFVRVGTTRGGLIALQLKPEEMPKAHAPAGVLDVCQQVLFAPLTVGAST